MKHFSSFGEGELSPVNSNAKRQLLGRQNEADAEVFNAAVPQMAT